MSSPTAILITLSSCHVHTEHTQCVKHNPKGLRCPWPSDEACWRTKVKVSWLWNCCETNPFDMTFWLRMTSSWGSAVNTHTHIVHLAVFLCFSDRASWCKSIVMTNLIHICCILQYVYYIIHLDMFRTLQCPSSGGPNCIMHHLAYHSENNRVTLEY
jgi:hypothetical protein